MSKRKSGLTLAQWKEVLEACRPAYAACVKIRMNHRIGQPAHSMADNVIANLSAMAETQTGDREFFSTKAHSTPG